MIMTMKSITINPKVPAMTTDKYYGGFMNKEMTLLLIAIVLQTCTACSILQTHAWTLQISGFETQVHAFEQASVEAGNPVAVVDLIIVLDSSIANLGEDGVCILGTNTTPVIRIGTNYWNTASDQGKEALLFHELGHCILGRVHNQVVDSTDVPESIMFPCASVFDSGVPFGNAICHGISVNTYNDETSYRNNRTAYINELFNPSTLTLISGGTQ